VVYLHLYDSFTAKMLPVSIGVAGSINVQE